MSRLNFDTRKKIAEELDARQRARFEAAGIPWPGRLCEVEAARLLGAKFIKHSWCKGECKGDCLVDHIFGNQGPNSKDVSVYRWLCRAHNTRHIFERKPRGPYNFLKQNILEQSLRERGGMRKKYKLQAIATNVYDEGLLVTNFEMAKSLSDGRKFEKVALRIMNEFKEALWADLVAACCQEVRCSIQFGDRKMRMLTAKLTKQAPFDVKMDGTKRIIVWKTGIKNVDREK